MNDKGEREKTKKEKIKKVAWTPWAYGVMCLGCALIRGYIGAKTVKTARFVEEKRKSAMLVLCNHTSPIDFALFTGPFFPQRVNFVVAENMQYSKPIFAKLLATYHAIMKKQFFSDFSCIKNIKKYLDAGINVVLCPEGKVSADGSTGVIMSSIGRLVKWLGYPVASIVTNGAGLMRPKWAGSTRRTKVICTADLLLDKDEVASLSKEDINAKIVQRLTYNEHKWQVENGVMVKGKGLAEGLERLLYRCPKCGVEFASVTDGERMKCTVCGNEVEYTGYGKILPIGQSVAPERIDLWFDEQKKSIAVECEKDGFEIKYPTFLFTENEQKNGYELKAHGNFVLNTKEMVFEADSDVCPTNIDLRGDYENIDFTRLDAAKCSTVADELKHLCFDSTAYETIAYIPGKTIDLYDEQHVYRFVFAQTKAATKYALAIERLAKLKS